MCILLWSGAFGLLAAFGPDRVFAQDVQPFEGSIGNGSVVPVPPPVDPDALTQYVDGAIETAMRDNRLPGVVVSIVSGDQLLMLKGYGAANAQTGERADPAHHLFRAGSITKLITATALMQLVEEGALDLNADVRTYLGDLGFDDALGPIKVRDLMTHTAGFEDRVFGYYGANPVLERLPREQQFAALAPKQVNAPATLTSYSNYGYALLGEIVARLSATSYAEAIERRVLAPLQMDRSTTRLRSVKPGDGGPHLEALRSAEAKGHRWLGGRHTPGRFPTALDLTEPEGSLSTTAADMARFMRMHLNDGVLDGIRLLAPDTIARMHTPLFSHAPGYNGNAHGFWISRIGGYQVLQHGGALYDFRSKLVLVPELGFGIFLSVNNSDGVLDSLPARIITHFFPEKQNLQQAAGVAATPSVLEGLAGDYLPLRRVTSRIGKIASLNSVLTITPREGGALLVSGGFGADHYDPISDQLFKNARTGEILSFKAPQDGPVSHVFFGGYGYERLSLLDHPNTLYGPVLLMVLAACAVFAGPLLQLVGYSRRKPGAQIPLMERGIVLLSALTGVAVIIQLLRISAAFGANYRLVNEAFPSPLFVTLDLLAKLHGIATVALILLSVYACVRPTRGVTAQVRLVLYTAIVVLFSWALAHWNSLSFAPLT